MEMVRSLNIGSQVANYLANSIVGLHIKTHISESPGQGGSRKWHPEGFDTYTLEEQEFRQSKLA